MAMNREQKRAMQRAGQVDAEGSPMARDRRQPAKTVRKEERTSPTQFFKEVRSELRKVAWPTREELIRYSIIVLVAIVALTIFVTVLDWIFLKFVQDFLFDSGVDATPAAGLISAASSLPGL
ncbi:MAG: preprotein translocase subunit SecE [Candidatus Microthrix subdominans]|jgi:preprotein translocase subunit SecE|nr:preprotein translocase subunit SecE [Candidatus Microthrix sp.]MBP9066353.1 preprotein translocase subunit SecE [Candidatus Microthrix sp.]HMS46408.1 preprotein translocase subunit SecE [Candidatus Microthrix sp.]